MFERPGKNKNVMKSAILIELLAIIVLVLLLLYQCRGKTIAVAESDPNVITLDSSLAESEDAEDAAVGAGNVASLTSELSLEQEAPDEAAVADLTDIPDVSDLATEAAEPAEPKEKVVVVEKIVERVVEKVVEKPVYLAAEEKSEVKVAAQAAPTVEPTEQSAPDLPSAQEEESLNSFFGSYTEDENEEEKDSVLDDAVKLARQILEKDPTNDKAYYFVSQDELKKRNYDLAMEALQHALEYNELNYLYYYDYGKLFFVRKDFVTAAKQFKRSIELNDHFHPTWYNLGLTYLKLNLYEPALEAFLTSVEVKPDYEKGWLETARTYNRLKDSDNAIHAYKKVISINGRNLQPVMELGSLYFEACRFVEAEDMYKAALENLSKGEEQTMTKYNLSIVLIEDKKDEEARNYAWAAYEEKDFIQSDSGKANVTYNYGLVMELLGNNDAALELYKEALSYNGEHAKAKLHLINSQANAAFISGDFEASKNYYIELINVDKENWGAYLNVAKCLIQLGDNENALRYLAYLNSKAPDFKSEEVEMLLNTLL